MNCTRFGLIAAIPILIMFSVLNGRTQALINDINETSVAVLNLIVREKQGQVQEPDRARAERRLKTRCLVRPAPGRTKRGALLSVVSCLALLNERPVGQGERSVR